MNGMEPREWDYSPGLDGEPFTDKDGTIVLGWHDRTVDQDEAALLAGFEAYFLGLASPATPKCSLQLRPVLMRAATDVECRINGWEEGTFVRCTPRAKDPWPMWQIEIPPEEGER